MASDNEPMELNFFESCSKAIRSSRCNNKAVQAVLILVMMISALLPSGLAIISIVPGSDSEASPISAGTLAVPVLSISHASLIYGSPGVPITIYINVTDTDGDTLTITWNWGDGTANDTESITAAVRTMVPKTHAWSPFVEQGTGGFDVTYTMTITVDDGTGNVVSGTRTVIISVPENIGPFLYLSAPTRIDPDDLVIIEASANDTEGESLTWTFIFNDSVSVIYEVSNVTPATAPGELVWNNATYIFGAEGNYTVTVSVSDALGANQVGTHNNTQTLMIQAVANKLPFMTSISIEPSNRQVNRTTGFILVNYSVEVQDPDGDVLNATWDFGGAAPTAYNDTLGGTGVYKLVQQVNYTNAGTYNISVVVTDGRPGHALSVYVLDDITSSNLPPSIWIFEANYSGKSAALPNQSVNFTLIITDPELDVVEVIVSFGDNSTLMYFNLTDFVDGNATITFSHSYSEEGNYTVFLWYTDNKIGIFNHSKEYNLTVVVDIPPPVIVFHYTWWDYVSMGLFAMIPVGIVVGYLRSRRTHKEIEQRGMSVDEWKLFQEVMDEEENRLK